MKPSKISEEFDSAKDYKKVFHSGTFLRPDEVKMVKMSIKHKNKASGEVNKLIQKEFPDYTEKQIEAITGKYWTTMYHLRETVMHMKELMSKLHVFHGRYEDGGGNKKWSKIRELSEAIDKVSSILREIESWK